MAFIECGSQRKLVAESHTHKISLNILWILALARCFNAIENLPVCQFLYRLYRLVVLILHILPTHTTKSAQFLLVSDELESVH